MEGPVEIRRKSSIKPGEWHHHHRESVKRTTSNASQDVNGGLLPNGNAGIPLVDGLPTYRDAVISPLDEEDEDDQEGEEETQLAVTCRVCNNEIIIEKEEGFVVKCGICKEATVSCG